MDAILTRFESSDQGTFGRILAGSLNLYTGELPWRSNASNVSCVPVGAYSCVFTNSTRFARNLYLLAPTDPRAGIRIHPANLMGDSSLGLKCQLNGCIALGERLGWIEGQKAVLLSISAVRKLELYFKGKMFQLEIREV